MAVITDPAEIASLTFRDLPDTDGEIVNNPYQLPQLHILSNSLKSRLDELHPEGDVFIGPDTGIYFMPTNPPMAGCRAPDWFYVPGVPAMEGNEIVRSYVMWQHKYKPPYFLVELISGPDGGERDDTPETGKFWIYERRVKAEYYVVFDAFHGDGEVDVYHLENGRYRPLEANAAGRFWIPRFGYELGVARGTLMYHEGPYLRFFRPDGSMVLIDDEKLDLESQRAEAERRRAKTEKRRANTEKRRADNEQRRADDEQRRAEAERVRAESAERQLQELMEKLRRQGIDPEAIGPTNPE